MNPANSALLTDLYQLTMLQGYHDSGMEEVAVFEFFVRKLRPGRGFLMAAGLEQALEFLGTYQGEITRTRQFVERLQALDLLIPRVLEVVRNNEPPMVLQGFSVVDEQRLAALSDADLLSLAREGYLALIYAHLGSLGNVSRLSERLDARLAGETPASDAEVTDSAPPAKKKRGNGKEVVQAG